MLTQSSDIEAYKRIGDSSILDPATPIKPLKGSVLHHAAFVGLETDGSAPFRRERVGEKKKMPNIEINNFPPKDVIQSTLAFSMPHITYGVKDTVLSFYSFDSQLGKMRRKRIKLNHLGKRWFIKKREREICSRFLAILAQGWSPFGEEPGAVLTRLRPVKEPTAPSVPVKDALQQYKDYVDMEVERKVMSPDTRRTYFSYVNKLLEFLPRKDVASVTTPDLVNFIDDKKVNEYSKKYCNSLTGWLKTVFGWMLERGLITENPALPLKNETLARQESRPTMTEEERGVLFDRLRKAGRMEFLLACMMEYYTYIRPNELYRVKVKFVNFEEQTITVPADISKNKRTAKVTLPNIVVELMLEMGIDKHSGNDYLFGKGMKCGHLLGNKKQFGRFWERHVACKGGIYPELAGQKKVFYSLKHSGITDMLQRGVPLAVVRDQARHQNISTTEIYARTSSMAPEGLKDYQ